MAQVWADIQALNPTEPERELISACRSGEICKLGDGCPADDSTERTVRAEILRYLILGGCTDCPVHEVGVQLSGAYIKGELDLSFAAAQGMTALAFCCFEKPVSAMQTRFEALIFSGSALPGLNAQGAEVKGGVFLDDGFTAKGEVSLSGAIIGGQLSCRDGKFDNPQRDALNAQGAEVKGSVLLDGGFTAKGEVSLSGAVIDGMLACSDGSFDNPEGHALYAPGAEVKGDVVLDGGFTAKGEVSLFGAVIGGQLICRGGTFENPQGVTLNAEGAEVKGGIFLRYGFTAKGEVRLSGAVIGGHLVFRGGTFDNPKGDALNAQGIEVKGGVFLDGDFTAKGEVSLLGAAIGVQLSCRGGTFENPKGDALNASGAEVKGGVFLDGDFMAKGEVSISGAVIGRQLSCNGGTFENPQGRALNAEGAEVKGAMFLDKVNIQAGVFSLIEAYARVLVDDPESWPGEGQLMLDGFTYDRIHGVPDSRQRLKWLARSAISENEFRPQPYTQLAQVLRRMGHDREAGDVMVERDRLIRKYARRRAIIAPTPDGTCCGCLRCIRACIACPFACLLDILLRFVVGYGYRPFRSLFWLVALWGMAAVVGYLAWQVGAMVPNSSVILTSPGWQEVAQLSNPVAEWVKQGAAGQDWETFNAIAWGFDVVVPIPLWQAEAWAPSPIRGIYGSLAWWGRWMLAVSGWVVAALAAAAFTGIIRRD